MKIRVICHLLLSIWTLSLVGCLSGSIAASGRSFSHLEDPEVRVDQVRKELGGAVFSRQYRPPLKIEDTPEYRARASEYKGFSPVVIARKSGSGFTYGEEKLTALCEVYYPKGWNAEPETQAYGMIGAMTLGVGDIAMVPYVLSNKAKSLKDGDPVTFWFDGEGKYVATSNADISKPIGSSADSR